MFYLSLFFAPSMVSIIITLKAGSSTIIGSLVSTVFNNTITVVD